MPNQPAERQQKKRLNFGRKIRAKLRLGKLAGRAVEGHAARIVAHPKLLRSRSEVELALTRLFGRAEHFRRWVRWRENFDTNLRCQRTTRFVGFERRPTFV